MAKKVAASGVLNKAEKNAAIPHCTAMRRSCSFRCSTPPAHQPMVPPICKAAPSRPALPPPKWVSTVLINMTGSSQNRMGLPSLTQSIISSVETPSSFAAL